MSDYVRPAKMSRLAVSERSGDSMPSFVRCLKHQAMLNTNADQPKAKMSRSRLSRPPNLKVCVLIAPIMRPVLWRSLMEGFGIVKNTVSQGEGKER